MILDLTVISAPGVWCKFEFLIGFDGRVSRGDRIMMNIGAIGGEANPGPYTQVICNVLGMDHLITEIQPGAAIRAELHVGSYDEMLHFVDLFKANYQLLNFSSNDAPADYYLLYRSALGVLGLGSPGCTKSEPEVLEFVEACRAVILAEIGNQSEFWQDYVNLTHRIDQLKTVISLQLRRDYLAAVKEWMPLLGDEYKWTATIESCKDAAELIASRFRIDAQS